MEHPYFRCEALLELLHELLLGSRVEIGRVEQRRPLFFVRKVPASEGSAHEKEHHLLDVGRSAVHELSRGRGDLPLVRRLQLLDGGASVRSGGGALSPIRKRATRIDDLPAPVRPTMPIFWPPFFAVLMFASRFHPCPLNRESHETDQPPGRIAVGRPI